MNRIVCLALIAALLLCLLPGCQTEEGPYVPTGNGLTWDEEASPEATQPQEDAPEMNLVLMYYPDVTMNPYACTDYTNRTLFSLIYQGLFAVDSDYNVTPVLCKKYHVSNDMRYYTFYIEDATFSDGTRLDIMDVYTSYITAKESAMYKGRFIHVKEITVTEDGGLTFRLDTAHENFPLLLDIPIIKAEEVELMYPVGTGPYYMEQTTSGKRLRRNDNWWCEDSANLIVNASAIPLTEAESVTQIRDAFEFTDVGLVRANPGSDSYADYRCDYELWDCENGEFLYLACNMNSEVFQEDRIRSALTYAIDREAIVEEFYDGFAHSASLPASPFSPVYNNKLAARYRYDSEKFADAVRTSGKVGANIRLLVNKNDSMRLRIARSIAQMLTESGLQVELRDVAKTYRYSLNQGEYDLYLGKTQLSPNMDLTPFFSGSGALRVGGLSDSAIYSMCKESLANQGNFYNLHQMVMDDGRLCPILFSTYSVHATRGLLTGLTPARDNVFYYDLGEDIQQIVVYEEPAEE